MTDASSSDLDVLSFGESLVDFLPDARGVPLRAVDSFRKTVGGAPTNLAVGLARLGAHPGLIGMIAQDEFGEFVVEQLEAEGVDVRGVVRTDRAQTGLTFVTLQEDGERSFQFYRDETADTLLRERHVDPELVAEGAVLQIGSNVLTEPGLREAAFCALEVAAESGSLVSFDPNIRPHVWDHPDDARACIEETLGYTDILKLNEEELAFLYDARPPREVWTEELVPRGIGVFAFTEGEAGARLFCKEGECSADAPTVEVVDTTGAGDGFLSGFLAELVARLRRRGRLETPEVALDWPTDRWREVLHFGCRVGARVCTALGATPGLPQRESLV